MDSSKADAVSIPSLVENNTGGLDLDDEDVSDVILQKALCVKSTLSAHEPTMAESS